MANNLFRMTDIEYPVLFFMILFLQGENFYDCVIPMASAHARTDSGSVISAIDS